MAKIPEFTDDMEIIQKLSDYPEQDMLTTSQFKACFDRAGTLIKTFLNKYVVPTINDYIASQEGLLSVDGGTMKGSISMSGNRITGLGDPTEGTQATNKGYVDASVRKAAPVNLLDNSDFTNLIAQVEIGGNHGSVAYAADRWIIDSGTVSYTSGTGLTLNGTIRQKLENAPATAYPYIGMASGTATIRYVDGAVTITSSGGVIKWAALYEGEYTAETLPDYQPKGYAAETAECHRYFIVVGPDWAITHLGRVSSSGTGALITVVTPQKMRVMPSVVVEDLSPIDFFTQSGAIPSATSVSVQTSTQNGVSLLFEMKGSTTPNTLVSARINTRVCLCADL